MKYSATTIALLFILQSLYSQIFADFSYESQVCGQIIEVQDISFGETVSNRKWYLDENLLASNAPANYTISVPAFSISDTVIVSLVVTGNSSTDSIAHEVICFEMPSIDAGDDFDACGSFSELNAISSGYPGCWLPLAGCIFYDYSSASTQVVNGGFGATQFTWTESNGMCTATDTITVTFWNSPSAEILFNPADSIVCGSSVEAFETEPPGTNVSSYWTYSYLNQWIIIDDQNPVFNVSQYGYHTFYWVEYTGPDSLGPEFCADTADVTLHFTKRPDINFLNENLSMNSENYTLMADAGTELSETDYSWSSNDPALTFDNPQAPATGIEYSGPVGSSFNCILTTDHLGCTDTDTISIQYYPGINYGNGGNEDISDEPYPFPGNTPGTKRIMVYPNPVKNSLSVQSNDLNYPLNIRIYYLTGQLAGSYTQNNPSGSISVNLPEGQYLVQSTESNGESFVSRIFITE